MRETDRATLDRYVELLNQNRERWLDLPVSRKIEFLKEMMRGVKRTARRQVLRACEAKGIDPNSPRAAEEWTGGPVIVQRNLRLLKESLEEIELFGVPRISPNDIRVRHNGQVAVKVFPKSLPDKLLYQGFSAEVWQLPEVKPDQLHLSMAKLYRERPERGSVALVLAAGNVASIGPLDAVYKLFVEGAVCLIKLNPVNDYLGPFIEEAFSPLFEEGFVRLAYGGADVGAYLCEHPGIDEIHITGSDKTHDLIVFGPGEEGARRKRENRPKLNKKITSELGNVSPVVIVPGNWSDRALKFHAENVVTQMTNNAGFNCNAAKVLITSSGWPQREKFLEYIRNILKDLPPRPAYYPGAEERFEKFIQSHPTAESFGKREGEEPFVPWTFIPGLDPEKSDDICFTEESFCAVTGETSLDEVEPDKFLARAAEFCNNTLWGTLNATVIIDPQTQASLGAEEFDKLLEKFRYGSIGVNHWAALSYALGSTTWGAYPGHPLNDIQSGRGVVHNTLMFDKPERSVVYGPFTMWPKPPWFVTHRHAHKLAPYLCELERTNSLLLVPPIVFWAALG